MKVTIFVPIENTKSPAIPVESRMVQKMINKFCKKVASPVFSC